MALDLDNRQRAMLKEMGVRVWQPGTAFAPVVSALPLAASPKEPRTTPKWVATLGQQSPQPAPGSVGLIPVSPPVVAVPTTARGVTRQAAMSEMEELGWPGLSQAASACQACGLCAGRKNATLQNPTASASPLQADWMVVGDPPDEDEDRLGRPFADQPGILLDNMLKAVGTSRSGTGASGAYLTNVVKCRPPHGHIPQMAELAQCASFLRREIALVQPKIILAMGRFACQLLLSEQPALQKLPLGKLRGTVHSYQGVPVVVTYHPQVLLRASADKAKAWADLCLAMQVLKAP